VAGVIAGGRFVDVVYGDAMRAAAIPTQLFFAIFTVSFLSTPLSMALYVLERTHVNLLIYVFLAVINVGLDLVLIPKFGVYGAIVPVAIAILLQPILYYGVVRRFDAGITIPFAYVGRCFLGAAPAVVMVPILAGLEGVVGLLAASAAGVVAIVAGYRCARVLGSEELALVAALPVPGAARVAAALGARATTADSKA
jgi:O-antigen/teichoic acid export membrane protein